VDLHLVALVVDWIRILGCFLVTFLLWHFMPCTRYSSHSRCGCCIDRYIVPLVYFSVLAASYFRSSGLRWRLL